MVTAELAAALPVLMILLAVAFAAVAVADRRVRAADAAREAARAAARGDPDAGRRLASMAAPGSSVTISRDGDHVVAWVRLVVHPMGEWLPGVTVSQDAVAAAEPGAPPVAVPGVPP